MLFVDNAGVTDALTAQFGSLKPCSGRYTLDQSGDALDAVESRRAIKAIITPNPSLFD